MCVPYRCITNYAKVCDIAGQSKSFSKFRHLTDFGLLMRNKEMTTGCFLCQFCQFIKSTSNFPLDAEKDNALCPDIAHEAKVGGKIALCCPVSAHPPPEVEWTFDGVKVKKSLTTTLVIPYVNESNYGSYYCTARSLEGAVGPFPITLNKTKCKLLVLLRSSIYTVA